MSTNALEAGAAHPPLPAPAVEGLRQRLRGTLLLPGAAGYDDARSVWNGMVDRRPALIARCVGVADVREGVAFAREHGLPLSIKGGGHNIAGLAVCDGGLALDLSPMRGVRVDPQRCVAHVQPGCLLGDVDRETQLHGLAAALGFVSTTGVAGLTLGGGFGYLSRRFGWTTDTVLSMDVVTAEGRLVRASAEENTDLFWALRGGGGNFGVVTDFTYRLSRVGPEVLGGILAWPLDRAPEVLEALRLLSATAPPELTCVALLRKAPPAPWLSPAVHGQPIVGALVCWTGPPDEGERLLAPLRGLGAPVGDNLQRRPYVTLQSLLDATQPKGRRYYWKSEYLPRLEPALLPKVVTAARALPSPHAAVILFQLGGAVADRPQDDGAVGNRDAAWVLNVAGAWDDAAADGPNIAWARGVWEGLRGFSTGGTYLNFLTAEEPEERSRAAWGANHARLVAVKRRFDPHNLFRVNRNIAP
jgi:FAD/FMN-containing dehydrogenase